MFFDSDYIHFKPSSNTLSIVDQTRGLPIVVLENEHKSVKRVAEDLQKDIEKVTGFKPQLYFELIEEPAIIVGTANNETLINVLPIDASELKTRWESYSIDTVVMPNQTGESIVILGSDNRGAIYGVYDITEKIGVSPWYWWMDVPVKKHEALYMSKGRVFSKGPSVQYRGFFLNDEGPSLMTWVRTHFPDFTHEFYEKIFELTLRLKGNYHWPAMWDSTFYEDDEKNIETADLYGVVIGTSHHEPMDRPHGDWKAHKQGPWDYALNEEYLKEFWTEGIERSKPYETIINLGMRGDGDEPMGGDLTFQEKVQLMEKIIKDQRTIIQDTMDVSVEDVPQMWALYKEVKEYYDSGMDVPEDVTLLWGDDNFGNIRRLPTKEERKRKGGAGIYYHFDYVGGPRSYKWVNTVPIQKTYEQMHKAYAYDAKKVWIVNVGDLKPMEYQTEFFMKLAWDVDAFSPDNLEIYALEWAEYTFGETHGKDVAHIIRDYVKFNGRLKPEILNLVEGYSWENEYEAERTLKAFKQTVDLAEQVYKDLPDELKDAFYQVAYYPAKASYTVLKLQLLVNLSKKYAQEGRAATKLVVAEAKRLFEEDKELTFYYNKVVSNGKWDHMMDQLHIGYTYWQQPDELILPDMPNWTKEKEANGKWDAVALEGGNTDVYTKKPLVVEVYNKGSQVIDLSVASDKDWLSVSKTDLTLHVQQRIELTVDWDHIPYGEHINGVVQLNDSQGNKKSVHITVHNPEETLKGGYVPIDGKIAIEAEDFTDKRETDSHQWQVIPDYGRTQSSVAIYPVEFDSPYSINESPRLSYDIVLAEETEVKVKVVTAPSLAFDPEGDMRLGISVNNTEPETVFAGDLSQNGERDSKDWEKSVIINAHVFEGNTTLLPAGQHTIHLTLIDPQVVIQKVIIDCGGEKPIFLGPLPTPHADKLETYQPYQPVIYSDLAVIPSKLTLNQTNTRVYVLESGFYSVDESVNDDLLVNEEHVVEATNQTVFLEKGSQDLSLDRDVYTLSIQLEKAMPLNLTTDFLIEEKEGVLRLVLHYYGQTSINYKMDVAIGNEHTVYANSSTKGYLKTDEQRVIPLVFDGDRIEGADLVILKLHSEGYTRTIELPISM